MLNRDFRSAVTYLEAAHQQLPDHRCIIKSFGYCYVWFGDLDKAQLFLADIPESKYELDALPGGGKVKAALIYLKWLTL